MPHKTSLVMLSWLVVLFVACQPPEGTEHGPCYGNGTCLGDLVCDQDICQSAQNSGDIPDSSGYGEHDDFLSPDTTVHQDALVNADDGATACIDGNYFSCDGDSLSYCMNGHYVTETCSKLCFDIDQVYSGDCSWDSNSGHDVCWCQYDECSDPDWECSGNQITVCNDGQLETTPCSEVCKSLDMKSACGACSYDSESGHDVCWCDEEDCTGDGMPCVSGIQDCCCGQLCAVYTAICCDAKAYDCECECTDEFANKSSWTYTVHECSLTNGVRGCEYLLWKGEDSAEHCFTGQYCSCHLAS